MKSPAGSEKYTEEELDREIVIRVSLRQALRIFTLINRRLRDRRNGLRNMKAKGKQPYVLQMQENQIKEVEELKQIVDDAIQTIDT